MNTQLAPGQQVTLDSANGHIRRVVIEDLGDVVVVTTTTEFLRATMAGIPAVGVGFKRRDVLAISPLDEAVSVKHNGQYEPADDSEAGGGGGGAGGGQ